MEEIKDIVNKHEAVLKAKELSMQAEKAESLQKLKQKLLGEIQLNKQ